MYDPHVNGQTLSFGISGLLYQSTVLFYDRQTESLWSQLSAEAISGEHAGATLRKLPHTDTTWGEWRRRHPDTLVLDVNTGHRRAYGRDPYAGYVQGLARTGPMYPVSHRDDRLAPNAAVIGIEVGDEAKAYPLRALGGAPARFTDVVGEHTLTLVNEPRGSGLRVQDADGNPVPTVRVLWFAWAAFHPDTGIYGQTEPASGPASAPTQP